MIHEELESQVSAMLDGELPAPECELLSRRLARDPQLRARWSRYALIGAAMRSEPVAGASAGFATRVSEAIAKPSMARRSSQMAWKAMFGSVMVAGVAGVAVLVLRADIGDSALGVQPQPVIVASQRAELPVRATRVVGSHEPSSYVVPPEPGHGSVAVLPAQLANYVLAHSEYSSPLTRSGLLSSVVSNEQFAAEVAAQQRAAQAQQQMQQQQAKAAEGYVGP